MRKFQNARLALLIAAAWSVTACGGGSTGERVNITPAPVPTPTPTPTPTPVPAPSAPPLPAGPTGLVSDQPFATQAAYSDGWGTLAVGDDRIAISYSNDDGLYTVAFGDGVSGQLHPVSGSGSVNDQGWITLNSTNNEVHDRGEPVPNLSVQLQHPSSSPYTYTSFGGWGALSCPMGCGAGVFAYGIPTAAGDVPISGGATYNGEIRGVTETAYGVGGTVVLNFDFAAGTLSGEMNPYYAPVWDAVGLGTYTFHDTVYSTGSTIFSGSFLLPSGATGHSWFSGIFTGPGASELQASWMAPYVDPLTSQSGTMAGVWIARRD